MLALGYTALPPDGDRPGLVRFSPPTILRTDESIQLVFTESMDPNHVVLGGSLGPAADPNYRWSRGEFFNSDLTLDPLVSWPTTTDGSLTVKVRDANENDNVVNLSFRVREPGYFDWVDSVINAKARSLGISPTVISATSMDQVAHGYQKDFPQGLSIYLREGSGEAFEVHGAIHVEYLNNGGPGGPLGFPTTDEMPTGPFGINRVSDFECGSIWWLAFPGNTGADIVPGCVPGPQ